MSIKIVFWGLVFKINDGKGDNVNFRCKFMYNVLVMKGIMSMKTYLIKVLMMIMMMKLKM